MPRDTLPNDRSDGNLGEEHPDLRSHLNEVLVLTEEEDHIA